MLCWSTHAPETREARCERERVAGHQTKARVVDLLRFGRSIDVHRQGHDEYEHLRGSSSMAEIWASSSCARSWRCPTDQAQRPGPKAWHAGAAPAGRLVTNAVTSNSPNTRRRPIFRPRRLQKFVLLVLVGNTPQGCAMRHGLNSAPSQELRAARIGYNGTTREDGLRHRQVLDT